jgi:RNA polymerase sigma factor (sigma-70 family)
MAPGQLALFLQRLRGAVDAPSGGLTDGELLERFAVRGDEAAFEVLVWRYGPLVWAVCQRLLRHHQDAEDAFQATFLTLVRKARSISRREALGAWLHKVAYRIALRARAAARRRSVPASALIETLAAAPAPDPLVIELRGVLDEEVDHLPVRYRTPFILCYLEGKTNAEAARQLGCPPGTVASRLAWARERLRQRLTRRGLIVSAPLLATLLAPGEVSSAVSSAQVQGVLRAVRSFAGGKAVIAGTVPAHVSAWVKGVTRGMFLTQLKVVTAILLAVSFVGGAAGLVAHRVSAQEEPGPEPAEAGAGRPEVPRAGLLPHEKPQDPARLEAEKQRLEAELEKARRVLHEAEQEYLDLEEKWTNQLIKARQELEKLNQQRHWAEQRAARLREVSRKELERAQAKMERLREDLKLRDAQTGAGKQLQALLDQAQKEAERAEHRLRSSEELELAQTDQDKLIAAEEKLRALEQRQGFERERARARVDASERRVRQLEGGEMASESGSVHRRLEGLERKVDALTRALDELRKELRRQPQ